MKAIILEKAGGIENLVKSEIEKPLPKENEVLVEVRALSINPVDMKVRVNEDRLNLMFGKERPIILGWDIAGRVVALGNKVSEFSIGDKVFGMVNFPGKGRCYAEYVVSPSDHLAKMPENVSYEEAAATTLAALTALQVMKGRIKKGDRVLIHAGAGGVGHFAIQIAKSMGAYVVTTASAQNRDFVLSLGADQHIDYRSVPFEEVAEEIDFVMDSMGGEILLKSIKTMKNGGSVITLPIREIPEEVRMEAEKRNINASTLMVKSDGADMKTLKEMLEREEIKPVISHTFPFDEIPKAHSQIETGRTVGKIVVVM